jgi:hypothetical protein
MNKREREIQAKLERDLALGFSLRVDGHIVLMNASRDLAQAQWDLYKAAGAKSLAIYMTARPIEQRRAAWHKFPKLRPCKRWPALSPQELHETLARLNDEGHVLRAYAHEGVAA